MDTGSRIATGGRIDASSDPAAVAALLKIPGRAVGRRCACRQCAVCRDNARWERIFQEKFADPTYYSPRPPRRGSSLMG